MSIWIGGVHVKIARPTADRRVYIPLIFVKIAVNWLWTCLVSLKTRDLSVPGPFRTGAWLGLVAISYWRMANDLWFDLRLAREKIIQDS